MNPKYKRQWRLLKTKGCNGLKSAFALSSGVIRKEK